MPEIRFYHVRTLLCTYLVWAILNLWAAYACCSAVRHPPFAEIPLTKVLYCWGFLHIVPLWGSIVSLRAGGGFMMCALGVVAGLSVVGGLLNDGRWARIVVIAGMSVWFLVAFFVLGSSA